MPRRGRHRTTLPKRLLAIVAALLVTGGVVTVAGSAFAESESGGSGLFSALSSDEGADSDSGEGSDDGSEDGQDQEGSGEEPDEGREGSRDGQDDRSAQDDQEDDQDSQGEEGQDQRRDQGQDGGRDGDERDERDEQQRRQDALVAAGQRADPEDPFPGRDQIAPAGEDDYVEIADVEADGGEFGEGGQFNGGSYTVDCGVSDHNNSDNYMAAPGKRNGAQHVHDYVGNTTTNANSDEDSLEQGSTSCVNGDQSTFFWPVLRDLNGTGPDVGEDGGSLDGNVGTILQPQSAQLTFRGHGDEPVQPMPTHLMIIMGNAKAGAQNGDNVNAKYTCTGQEDRVTDKYPVCGEGSNLVRLLDYPSCWDGQNLESANLRDHMAFPDDDGNCSNGFTAVPALRITLTYDQPEGRAFSIDSFPNEQHDPSTDHSDFENMASEDQSRRGADCINNNEQCANIPREG